MGTIHSWSRKHWLQFVVLSISGWCAFYVALIVPMHLQYERQRAAARSSGLSSVYVGYDPLSLWRQRSLSDVVLPSRWAKVARGAPLMEAALGGFSYGDETLSLSTADHAPKIVRNATLALEVKSPAETAEKIRALAEAKDGYLVSSEVSGDHAYPAGTITIRVPASRYEEARSEIRKLAARVEREQVEAKDMTVDYVDKEARLRSLRAQEAQYLTIMRRATTVKDTLEAAAKLGEVRGQIEQGQAEFAALAKQVETVAISVSLRAQADAQVFGLHWRPMYELKLAARDGLDSLANYTAVMTAALFQLPAVLLWLATIFVTATIGWRGMRWGWKKLAPVHTISPS